MKKNITLSAMLLIAALSVNAQNNLQLVPGSGNVCNPMPITFSIQGNSFNPVSYLWSTGETSPVIEIATSGTYTLTITGYHGNSNNNLVTLTKSATYNVLPVPQITALTDLWVCKFDTIRLEAVPGYDGILWSNGSMGVNFEKVMNNPGTPGTPSLDTMSISYTASVTNVCAATSEKRVLRSIRRPPGVGPWYEDRMNIRPNDSIPASYVLEYLYPVRYEMVFTDTANPANVITHLTAPGTHKAPANILTPGHAYHVVTTPVINGVHYCHGATSTIGIRTWGGNNRLSSQFTPEEGLNNFRVFDVQGRLLMEKQAEQFDQEWLSELAPQVFVIQRTGKTTETIRMQVVD